MGLNWLDEWGGMSELELLASGYSTVEGPTVDSAGNLYFGNVQAGGVHQLTPAGDINLIVPKRKGVGGICLHADGGIVVSGRDLTHVRDGQSRIIFGGDDCRALGLVDVTGFNDIHADDQGRIFAGAVRHHDFDGGLGCLLLVTAPHQATLVYDQVAGSNGLALDWAKQRLYHSVSHDHQIVMSDRFGDLDYRVVDRWSTAELGGIPDGLALDEEGCVWVAIYQSGCVVRLSERGELLHRIDVPADLVTSVCFAGPEGTDLIIVTGSNTDHPELGGCIFRTRVSVRGAPVGAASI
jgi:D-xylonolactonase